MSQPVLQWIRQTSDFDTADYDGNYTSTIDNNDGKTAISAEFSKVTIAFHRTRIDPDFIQFYQICVARFNTNGGYEGKYEGDSVSYDNYPTLVVDKITGESYILYSYISNHKYILKLTNPSVMVMTSVYDNMITYTDSMNYLHVRTTSSVNSIALYGDFIYCVITRISNSESNYDVFVFRLKKSDGNFVNSISISNTPASDALYNPSIAIGTDGSVYIAYHTNGLSGGVYSGASDIVVAKIKNDLSLFDWAVQQPSFNTPDSEFDPSICVDNNGNVYVSYTTNGTVSNQTKVGSLNIVIVKFDTDGTFIWARQQPSFNVLDSRFPTISIDNTKGVLLITYQTNGSISGLSNTNIGSFDIAVLCLDFNGNYVWAIEHPNFNTLLLDYKPSIASDNAGNAYISYVTEGMTSGNSNYGNTDVVVFKLGSIVCFAKDTLITMNDGTLKNIQDVQRGDITITGFTVANLCCSSYHKSAKIDFVTFEPGCLGENIPNKQIIVTSPHPIVYKGARRPASCFVNLPGVKLLEKQIVGELLEHIDDTIYLYDLQFEVDGYYLANNMVVQSRSPNSFQTPLPKELYFNQELYSDKKVNDFNTQHDLPFIVDIL